MRNIVDSLKIYLLTLCTPTSFFSQIDNISITNSCVFNNIGSINITLDSSSLSAYSLPFILEWENITTGDYAENISVDNYIFEIEDLFSGHYEIVILLGDGCQINIDTIIEEISTDTLTIYPRLYHPTCGKNDGMITVQASGGTPPYIYSWNKIQNQYFIKNLKPGEYCVTITDQNCGYIERCMILEELTPIVKINSISQISSCEPLNNNSCDGGISISVENVNQPQIYWINSAGDTIGSGTAISNLCTAGSYLISVSFSDYCQPWVYEVFVGCCNDSTTDIAVYLDAFPGCGDPNALSAIVTGGVEPYLYQWSNLETSASIDNLANEEYFVTVTDSLGCSVVDSFDFHFVDELSRIDACKGFQDGEITFQINNSGNCPVTITYDYTICSDCTNMPVIEADTHSIIELTLTQLGGNIDYTYYINICGCRIPYKFKLNEEEWDKTYSGFEDIGDWTFLCTYDIECKETQIDSGLVELATVDLNPENLDCEGLFTKDCGEIEYKCENTVIKTRDVNAKIMRRERAVQLAQTLMYDPGLISGTTNNGNPCDWISVCPNDPTCVHGEFHYGGDFQNYQYLGNNCWRVRCKIGFVSTSYKICGLDYVPEYLYNYYDPTFSLNINLNGKNCNAVERNVGQLARFIEEYVQYNPDFYGTDLHTYLLAYQNDSRRWCAKVRFCTSNFEIIEENIEDVVCEVIDPPLSLGGFVGDIEETCKPYIDAKGDLRVFCSNLCNSNRPEIYCPPQPVLIDDDFKPTLYTFTGGETVQMLARYSSPSNFIRLSPAKQNDSLTTVNAVFQSTEELLYHSFHPSRWSPNNMDNIEYLYQHFDSSYMMGVLKDTTLTSTYNVLALTQDTLLRYSFESSYLLNFLKFWTSDSIHAVTGNFTGNLMYDSVILSSSLNTSFFISGFDKNLNPSVFHKIYQNGWKICIDEQTGDLALWSPSTTSLYLDNVLQSGISSGEIVTMAGLQDSLIIRNQNLILQSNLKLLDYKRGAICSNYLIAGTGRITLNGTQVYNTATSKVIILNMDNNGSINFIEDYNLSAIDTSLISIEITPEGISYFSFNTIDDISIGDSLLVNEGETDIAVFSIDTLGNYTNIYSYKSSSEEKLFDIFYSDGILFIGGELDEETYSRTIGEYSFENYSAEYKQAFTSYIIVDKDSNDIDIDIANENLGVEQRSVALKNKIEEIKVLPNPTSDNIFVSMTSDCDLLQIYIKDFSGRVYVTEQVVNERILDSYPISLGEMPPGVYYVSCESSCYFAISKPFIIIK